MPKLDYEDPRRSRIARQIAQAQALRTSSMTTPTFGSGAALRAEPVWGNLAQGLAARYLEYKADQEAKAIDESDRQATSELMSALPRAAQTAQRPSWTPEQAAPQATGGGGQFSPLQPEGKESFQQMKPYEQQMNEGMEWGQRALQSRDPMARELGGKVLTQALAMPGRALEREDAQAAVLQKAIADREAKREAATEREAADRRMKQFAIDNRQPREAPRDRFQIDTDADGSRVRVNLDTGEITPLGITKPAAGKGKTTDPTAAAEASRNALKMAGVTGTNDPVAQLINSSTSGGLESVLASAKGAVTGTATKGMGKIGELETISNSIVLDLLNGKLGANISNADVSFLQGTLGKIADPNIPANQRLDAWNQAKGRMERIANGAGKTMVPEVPPPASSGWSDL